ncbi:MAG: DUF167 domain-containing protein [Dehalococcoidales bacterium]|nr:DUF167 domain-containing protein [Dehalococcoidales bacterium]
MKIQVKVKPGSKNEEVTQKGDTLIVTIKEPPKEGRANRQVIKLLAKHFKVPQNQVKLISGFKQRDKVVEIVQR